MMPFKTLIFASSNPSKIRECQVFFKPFEIDVVSSLDLNLESPPETGETFLDNAILKARAAHNVTKKPVLADDSGLCVAALGDRPGVFSARYAAENGGYDRVFAEWGHNPGIQKNPAAHLKCVLVLLKSPNDYTVFEGRVDVTLTFPATSPNARCYDPILTPLLPDGTPGIQTFDQMTPAEKNRVSHRGRAFQSLKTYLLSARV